MAWYRTGTISLTNGSTTVTGSGTTWIANAGVGEALYAPDGKLYEIANIASDTSITLASAYLGTTASAQPYVIVPSQSYIRDLAEQAADLVNNYATIYNTVGQGKFPSGTLAAPAVRFSDDLDTGFYRSASNEVTFVAGGVAQFKYDTTGISFVTSPAFTTPISVTANSSSSALRITQTGTGNALLVEDSANPDATPFVVAANGSVVIGDTATTTTPNYAGTPQAEPLEVKSAAAYAGLSLQNYVAGSGAAGVTFAHSRSGALGTHTILNDADITGSIVFSGSDGTNFIRTAQIDSRVDGTPGTNDMPGRLVFSTTADGASSTTERMRIDSLGNVGIGATPVNYSRVFAAGNATTNSFSASGFISAITIPSTASIRGYGFNTGLSTADNATVTPEIRHYSAEQGTITGGSRGTVTNQRGFFADSGLTGATNNYGFYGNIASGTGRWNFYAAGTADNYFAGNVGVGAVPSTFGKFVVGVAATASSTTNMLGMVQSAAADAATLRMVGYRYTGPAQTAIDFIQNSGTNFQSQIALSTDTGAGITERMRIASTGTISLGAAPGAESLRVTPVASAVNYFEVQGAITGSDVTFKSNGSDTNIGLLYASKGAGRHRFFTNDNNNEQFRIAHTTSAVNYLQVTGGATGVGVALSAQGSDANIINYYSTKGTGAHSFFTGGGSQFTIAHVASAVNALVVYGSATGTAVQMAALGSDTNIDIALTPKGTGNVRFGTHTSSSDVAISGYITIKDSAGNTRKLAVIS